jgi:integrase
LTYVTPHTLKHTAVTWAAIRRVPIDDAAVFFATSASTLRAVYAEHAPELIKRVAEELGQR